MKDRKQVNVELPETLARRVKADAAALGVLMSAWSQQAFEHFLAMPVASRRVSLGARGQRKIMGRKLAL